MSIEAQSNGQTTAEEFVQYEVDGGVATIWLNRPEVRNCVNWGLLVQLGAALERAEGDEAVRVVVIRGRGQTFCAGADLNMLDAEFLGTTTNSVKIAQVSAKTFDRAFNLAKPTIAVVEGYAVAGGFELLISCDFCVAADDAKIGDFHIRRALFGGAGPIYRLPRYIGLRKTKELLLTGKLLSGVQAREWGLANVSAPTDQLEEALEAFVAPLKDKSAFTMRITKLAANRGLDGDTETLIALESMTCNVAHQSEDAREGVQAFLEKRDPELEDTADSMDFAFDPTTLVLRERLLAFMDEHVYPAEARFRAEVAQAASPWDTPPVIEELKTEARARGLWNLFLPPVHEQGAGLTNLQYAPLAEITGHNPWIAPEALNCSAPDTGNMELLSLFGTAEQKQQWLDPLLEGTIRSAFSMTEPEVASSDATNIATRIERDGNEYVINGRKWWTSGAMSPRCKLLIVMGVTDPDAERHRRQSMILVPKDTPGIQILRSTSLFGYDDGPHGGHAEIIYDNVRVPASNLLGEEGDGFRLAQERLGPGRIHHAMRAIGMAERALEMMCRRTAARSTFGRPIIEHGVVQRWISEARVRIEQVRLLVLKTAWLMDTVGNRGARIEVSAIKVAAPDVATWVIDRAIQAHGGGGVSQDHLLAELYAVARILQIADGPDEVHHMAIARRETRGYREAVTI